MDSLRTTGWIVYRCRLWELEWHSSGRLPHAVHSSRQVDGIAIPL